MSNRYKGGIISATPPTTTSGYEGTASGAWTLEQQYQAQGAGAWPSQPNFGVEDVFNTYLYNGSTSNQTFTTGIDMLGKGGIVVIKNRANGTVPMYWCSQNGRILDSSNSTSGASGPNIYPASNSVGFNSDGISIASGGAFSNASDAHVAWSFRKQPKFFDVVTWTGTGVARTISHNLGSTPGCIIIRRIDTSSNWTVYHRSLSSIDNVLQLESTSGEFASATRLNSTAPTSTNFTLGTSSSVNASGGTYTAYLFAHNAGGFGPNSTDSIISCGIYTANNSTTGPVINLGWEPQFVMIKKATGGTGDWFMMDNMRGIPTNGDDVRLFANLTSAEVVNGTIDLTSTGFQLITASEPNTAGCTYIYIAIRRGPMRAPTSGTSVFTPVNGVAAIPAFPAPHTVDMQIAVTNKSTTSVWRNRSRLTQAYLDTTSTVAETADTSTYYWDTQTGFGKDIGLTNVFSWLFRRAPNFFDEVCYTGTGSATTVTHNLGAVPELMIVKRRSGVGNWVVYSADLGNATQLVLDSASASSASAAWNSTTPTSTVFSIGTASTVNSSAITYVAYLFATCPGVSKVGRYSGTGAEQIINCGFTSGARFVLIKRDNAASTNWYVWDSARGITSSTDPFLWINTTNAENTTTNYVDTDSTGFKLTASAPSQLNASGGTYIFLAIA